MKLNAVIDAVQKHNNGVLTITNIFGKDDILIGDITRNGVLSVVTPENGSSYVQYTRPSGIINKIDNLMNIDRISTTTGLYLDDTDGVVDKNVSDNDSTTTKTPEKENSGSNVVNDEGSTMEENSVVYPYCPPKNNHGCHPIFPDNDYEELYEYERLERIAHEANWEDDRINDEDGIISNLHRFLISNSTEGMNLDSTQVSGLPLDKIL